MDRFSATRAVVRAVLEKADAFPWSLQGFGMLRTYLDDRRMRLHVWDSRFAVLDVSTIHDHPWHFDSLVVSGFLEQTRFAIVPESHPHAQPFEFQTIRCGPGGCAIGEAKPVHLFAAWGVERYGPGSTYRQRADEIHESRPHDGTVTLVERHFLDDEEHARVFWRRGETWVSAEPREATPDEVRAITRHALEVW